MDGLDARRAVRPKRSVVAARASLLTSSSTAQPSTITCASCTSSLASFMATSAQATSFARRTAGSASSTSGDRSCTSARATNAKNLSACAIPWHSRARLAARHPCQSPALYVLRCSVPLASPVVVSMFLQSLTHEFTLPTVRSHDEEINSTKRRQLDSDRSLPRSLRVFTASAHDLVCRLAHRIDAAHDRPRPSRRLSTALPAKHRLAEHAAPVLGCAGDLADVQSGTYTVATRTRQRCPSRRRPPHDSLHSRR